jgi:ASC-1-like (ASCH) protein
MPEWVIVLFVLLIILALAGACIAYYYAQYRDRADAWSGGATTWSGGATTWSGGATTWSGGANESAGKKITKLIVEPRQAQQMYTGERTIDIRIKSPTMEKIEVGDLILYSTTGISGPDLVAKVIEREEYDNLAAALADVERAGEMSKLFPDAGSSISAESAVVHFLARSEGGQGYYKKDQLEKPFVLLKVREIGDLIRTLEAK